MNDLHQLSAGTALQLMHSGNLRAVELMSACLARITEREPHVGAWEFLDTDAALGAAEAADRAPSRGPLHGLPVGIKDIMDTIDMPTGYGSAVYRKHRPAWDAAMVAQLRTAGAVVVGKTVTSEFAAYAPGRTCNPHDPALMTGISSMGSAAAVADFMVPLATGTQTGSSIIRPASFCGAIGYKPSFGLFNRSGIRPLAESLDTAGFFVRETRDIALFGSVLGDRPGFGMKLGETAPRLGLCRTHAWGVAASDARKALERAGEDLSNAGAEVVELELPHKFSNLNDALSTILRYETARAFTHEYRTCRSELRSHTVELIEAGLSCETAVYEEAQALARKCRSEFEELLSGIDALVTLSAECEALPISGEYAGDSVFNRIWTLLHVPCISLPVLQSAKGLPIGLQLVGRNGDDSALVGTARWVEARLQ